MPADIAPMPLDGNRPETSAEREERIRWEAASIARGRAEIAAGLGIDGDALDAWFDQLEENENAPFPAPTAVQPPAARS